LRATLTELLISESCQCIITIKVLVVHSFID